MSSVERIPRPSFRVTATDLGGDVRELKVEGELDLAVADRLRDEISRADGSAVLIDMSDCDFVDSTGIAVVLLARRDGARIVLHSPCDQVRRVLSVAGLTEDGLVFSDRDEAMAALGPRERP